MLFHILYSIFYNKCTRCHKGDVFVKSNPYQLKHLFDMHPVCSHCGLKYEKETGFFYGAMYVSYALNAGWFIIWFTLRSLFFKWEVINFLIFFVSFIIILSPVTFRWSRIIWLYFFYPFKKEYQKTPETTEINTTH